MRNFPALRLVVLVLTVAAALPAIAHAHPGHDEHELTWDMSHLAAYPWATLGCFAAIGGIAWLAGRMVVRVRAERLRNTHARLRR